MITLGKTCDSLIEIILLALLVFTPLAFGTVEVWSNSLMILGILAVLLCRVIKCGVGKQPLFETSPLYLFIGLFLFFILFQLIPLPLTFLSILSSNTAQLYSETLSHSSFNSISIYRYATFAEGLRLFACLMAFLVVSEEFQNRGRQKRLLAVLISTAAFIAFYGIIEHLSGSHRIFGYHHRRALMATGTFINRNHFAAYLGMIIPLTLSALIVTSDAGKRILLGFLAIVMAIGILLSGSRMGIASWLISSFAIAGLYIFQGNASRKSVLFMLVTLPVALLAALWLGVGSLFERFAILPEQFSHLQRPVLWKAALGLFADFPIFGTGLGTFGVAFTRYKPPYVETFWEHAHNDYLEAATEVGALGLIFIISAIAIWFFLAVKTWFDRKAGFQNMTVLGIIGSAIYILLHSATDFNMHISSNALTIAVIMGLGMAIVKQRNKQRFSERNRFFRFRYFILGSTTLFIAFLMFAQIRIMLADRMYKESVTASNPLEWDTQMLKKGSELCSGNMQYPYSTALNLLFIRQFSNTTELEDAEITNQAEIYLDQTIQACPASSKAHALKAYQLSLKGDSEEAAKHLQLAETLDPSWAEKTAREKGLPGLIRQ